MRFQRKTFSPSPFLLLGLVVILVGLAGYGLFSGFGGTEDAGPSTAVVASGPEREPRPDEPLPDEPLPDSRVLISETVQQGDTAGKILQSHLSPAEIQALSDACAENFDLCRLREGKPYVLTITAGEFECFEYEIDNDKKLMVERRNGDFVSKIEAIDYDVEMRRITGDIKTHLFQAVADAGESPLLAIAMADIFAWEINFIRDLRPGDSFTLIVEKRFRNGEFKDYGRILGAFFVNQGVTYEAYLFKDASGFPHYYTGKGESVKRAFLKAPLSFTRISSTFSSNRLHPVLKVWRAHPAVDYAAPTGTPVKAIGNGTVTFKGWGKGAGNYVALRHGNGYESMYLHLSAFAGGLKTGKKVRQGEVIGFVGSTGYATGPHLDFRMKKDGQYINPIKTVSPRTEPVAKKDFPAFQKIMDDMRMKLAPA